MEGTQNSCRPTEVGQNATVRLSQFGTPLTGPRSRKGLVGRDTCTFGRVAELLEEG